MNLLSAFDVQNIQSLDCIPNELQKDTNFLAYIPVDKTYGRINRNGDILCGIRNKEEIPMQITLFHSLEADETTAKTVRQTDLVLHQYIVKPNEVYLFPIPLPIIKLYLSNTLFYRVSRVVNHGWSWWQRWFESSIVDMDFVYGFVATNLRREIMKQDMYYVQNNRLYFFPVEGFFTDWLYVVAMMRRGEQTEYFRKYLNHELRAENFVEQFQQENPTWINILQTTVSKNDT